MVNFMLSPIYKHKINVKVPKKLTSSLLIDIELHLEDLIMGFFEIACALWIINLFCKFTHADINNTNFNEIYNSFQTIFYVHMNEKCIRLYHIHS